MDGRRDVTTARPSGAEWASRPRRLRHSYRMIPRPLTVREARIFDPPISCPHTHTHKHTHREHAKGEEESEVTKRHAGPERMINWIPAVILTAKVSLYLHGRNGGGGGGGGEDNKGSGGYADKIGWLRRRGGEGRKDGQTTAHCAGGGGGGGDEPTGQGHGMNAVTDENVVKTSSYRMG
ncbi:unnamed protein product [Protopolystoma xenopodis]|uniref:Uncharacterized protein n=1 Tax=Protopolystoma xenopodis TaxID=117903 RepID=A0A448WCG1_9PLAT|nr:unnamed protein product [Protopolystoma xenopodis]